MIDLYCNDHGRLKAAPAAETALRDAVWLDLQAPDKAEEHAVEAALGVDIPTREEMEEIEISSRLYYDGDAAIMTATLPSHTDGDEPTLAPVSFVLSEDRLVTVRYHEPRAFKTLPMRAAAAPVAGSRGIDVLVILLELQIDRLADVLERAGRDINALSGQVFRRKQDGKPAPAADFRSLLEAIGRKGDLTSSILECLVSLERMFGFLGHYIQMHGDDKHLRARLKTLSRDCRSLIEHSGSLTSKITFLLDATLGLINIEQNAIIKIFSVAAVAFLPPTLIASIYGMNFHFMPELDWPFGYPGALVMMVISALVPLWYFKRRGWL